MADFDNTALNFVIPETWQEKIEDARYASAVIMNRVSNKSQEVAKFGDIIHVPIEQAFSVGTVSAAGAFTPQNYTVGGADVTIDQWEQIAVQILDRAKSQAFWTPGSNFPSSAGKAFASRYDAQLASLHSSVASANQLGNLENPAEFDDAAARESVLRLAATNIPLEDLSFILHPAAYYKGLAASAQLTAANTSGQSKNVLTTGYQFPLLGVPVYYSTNIVRTGTPAVYKNLLVHRSSMAIAWQRKSEIERTRATANLVLADLIVMQALYGFAIIRTDHAVVWNSKA